MSLPIQSNPSHPQERKKKKKTDEQLLISLFDEVFCCLSWSLLHVFFIVYGTLNCQKTGSRIIVLMCFSYKKWISLTGHISEELVTRWQPECGVITSVAQFLSPASNSQSRKLTEGKVCCRKLSSCTNK